MGSNAHTADEVTRRRLLAALAVAGTAPLVASCTATGGPQASDRAATGPVAATGAGRSPERVLEHYPLRMEDGVSLSARLWTPAGADQQPVPGCSCGWTLHPGR